jgi:hypothetical protein
MNLLKSGLIACLALVSSINTFGMQALAETTSLVMFKTRAGYYVNSYDSRGALKAIPEANFDPNVSDEIFRLKDLNGGSLKNGDLIMLKTRAGYYVNSYDSRGALKAIPEANFDPNVSDEIFRLKKIDGSSGSTIRNGDKILIQTRRGYFFNCVGSIGKCQAIENANYDPKVSDEIFTIRFR